MPSMDTVFQFVTAALLAWITIKSHNNSKAIDAVHLAVNSRLDQLLAVTKELATKTGIAAGRAELREEQKKPPGGQ